MAESVTISIDQETAELVEELKNTTRLTKTEIARQAFTLFKQAIEVNKGSIVILPTPSPAPIKQS